MLIPLCSDPRPGNQEVRAGGESPYSFSTEPLFLIPSRRYRRPGSQEIRLAGMHCTFFRGNQFSSFLPARTAALEAKRSGSPGCTALFQGNQFSSFLPAGTAALEARRSGSPGCTALFFKGTSFPHSLCFTDAVGRTGLFSSSSSSSSSPQRDSGILAVRKTGASVLRLLPPTP